MKINHEYILAVTNYGSFSKAAASLFIAQPALSRYVISLENYLGAKIFDRSKSTIVLTAAGQELIEYLNKSKELERTFYAKLNELKGDSGYKIKLGVVPWRLPLFLPRIVPAFKKKFPHIEVTINEDVSPNLEESVVRGELDVCVVNGPADNAKLEYVRLSMERITLITPRDSGFACRHKSNIVNSTCAADWRNETFILLRKDFRLGKIAREIFHYYRVEPKCVIEVWNMNSAISMVCAGIGMTFIPASGIPRTLPKGERPVSYKVTEGDFMFPLLLAYKRERSLEPKIRILADFISCYYPVQRNIGKTRP